MNAKEISDSTLPAVTPADNDLMILYDVSEGTTGKAPIADLAPKVAENIDIATLPTVTPAADNVLMIGDTSAGTTGKATIAGIAPKVAENIDIIDGSLTILENVGGIVENFAKKYGRIAQIQAYLQNCNLEANTLTEVANTNLLPLITPNQMIFCDDPFNLNLQGFLHPDGKISIYSSRTITVSVHINGIYLCR